MCVDVRICRGFFVETGKKQPTDLPPSFQSFVVEEGVLYYKHPYFIHIWDGLFISMPWIKEGHIDEKELVERTGVNLVELRKSTPDEQNIDFDIQVLIVEMVTFTHTNPPFTVMKFCSPV